MIPSSAEVVSSLIVRRGALIALAFAGTALYVSGIYFLAPSFFPIALMVGIAAGVSWPIFGFFLLYVGNPHAGAWEWADDCLDAIRVGIFIKTAAVLATGLAVSIAMIPQSVTTVFQIAALLIADVAMGYRFTNSATARGMSRSVAIVLWLAVLNGVFAQLLLLMVKGWMQ